MVVVIILVIVLLGLVIGFLLIPIDVCIDTVTNQYYIQFRGLARASIEGHKEELICVRLKILFGSFYFYPFKAKVAQKKKATAKKIKKHRTKSRNLIKIIKMLKTFKVRGWSIDMDTGDCILNSKLYAAFALLNRHIGHFRINFEGRNNLVLLLENRPLYLIKSFINT